jgi:uncharacterized tellurite resistance protein B-like protein
MRLFDRVREHLARHAPLAVDAGGDPSDLELRAATAVLLLEAAYGDEEYAWREHRAIVKGLERDFGIGRRETLALLGRAEEIRPPVVQLADVTQVIRERFSAEQREEVLALLWEVIAADAKFLEWEESFAAHVAGAVDVAPERAAEARRRARA